MSFAKKSKTKAPNVNPPIPKAVLYARVSSKEQEKEGFSIPAQLKLLGDYALQNDFKVAREYVDIETAKTDGRKQFGEMVLYLKRHPSVRTILVEKTDRLYRNLKDWVLIDELDIEIHLVKEGVSLSRDSRSSEKFMHGIKVLMAKNYIDNLSEEVRKGMAEKASQGLWPSAAPMGYVNVVAPDGKRIIEVDPEYAHIIPRMFEWYASGNYNLREIGAMARRAGLVFRRTKAIVPVGSIARILRNRVYTGEFEWLGRVYQGKHTPLVDKDLWLLVQDVLDGRFRHKLPKTGQETRDFAFTAMISCGHCGCAMTAEIKKEKYIYYHCTATKGKCPEKYAREEVIAEQFAGYLRRLRFDDEIYDLIVKALKSSFSVEREEYTQAVAKVSNELARLRQRLEGVYIDKLDGKISEGHYDRISNQWRDEANRCEKDLTLLRQANDSYMDEGVALLRLARDAHTLFETQAGASRKMLLDFVLSNCSWANGQLTATFREPFNLLEESLGKPSKAKPLEGYDNAEKDKWLGN